MDLELTVHCSCPQYKVWGASQIRDSEDPFLCSESCRARQLEIVGTGVPLKSYPLLLCNLDFKPGIDTFSLFVFNVSNAINQYF